MNRIKSKKKRKRKKYFELKKSLKSANKRFGRKAQPSGRKGERSAKNRTNTGQP